MDDTRVYIEIPPEAVNYINRIIEGYEYLGILTTLDPKRATCQINSTADTRDIVIDVLTHLTDVDVKNLGSREEGGKKEKE